MYTIDRFNVLEQKENKVFGVAVKDSPNVNRLEERIPSQMF